VKDWVEEKVFRYLFVLEMLDGVELLKGSKVFHENDQKAIKEWL
jgi:hypothetical protein